MAITASGKPYVCMRRNRWPFHLVSLRKGYDTVEG